MKNNDKHLQFDFHHLASQSRDIIYRLRLVPSRYYEYISPAVTDWLGYTPEECYADPDLILSRVHPDFQEKLVSSRRGQVKFDEYEELCAFHKDGRLVWAERVHIPIYDDTGRLVAIEGICRDTTERKQTEEALRKTQESLLLAQEVAHFGSFERNLETMDGWWSDEFFRILSVSPQEGSPSFANLLKYVHPEDVEHLKEKVAIAGVKAGDYSHECRIIRPSGEVRTIYAQVRILGDESGTPIRVVGTLLDITERKETEDALHESEKTTRALLNAHTGVAILIDHEGMILAINEPLAQSRFGESGEKLTGSCVWDLYPSDVAKARKARVAEVIRSGEALRYTDTLVSGRIMDVQMCPVLNEQGKVTRVAVYATDITAIKELEEQLLQSQKMEAIGTLAGGIAHDFNNILTGIMGYTDLLSLQLPDDPKAKADLSQIQQLTDRAAKLTAQLLLFSRQQTTDPTSLDLNAVIENTLEMLEPLIGEDIVLTWIPGPDLGTIRADESQLGQILINLGTNARDAMPSGGTLTIETSKVTLDREYVKTLGGEGEPGAYVLWRITDTGAGMDATTQQKIFDPFFTTKEVGKGTGLGLSTVHGIVNKHGAHIQVESEPGKGTSFTIYWPTIDQASQSAAEEAAEFPPQGS